MDFTIQDFVPELKFFLEAVALRGWQPDAHARRGGPGSPVRPGPRYLRRPAGETAALI